MPLAATRWVTQVSGIIAYSRQEAALNPKGHLTCFLRLLVRPSRRAQFSLRQVDSKSSRVLVVFGLSMPTVGSGLTIIEMNKSGNYCMKKSVVLFLGVFFTLATIQTINAQTIAQWTFETTANTTGLILAPGAGNSPGTVQADNGLNYNVSTASGLHATAATYSAPAGDLDPTIAGLASGTSGPGNPGSSAANASPSLHGFGVNNWSANDYWSFTTSTLGFTSVTVAFDQAGSSTGPANFGLSYSINGGTFTSFTNYSVALSTWNTTTADPSSLSFAGGGVFDNASSITFRLVDLNATSIGGGTVGTAGTDRVDNFTVVSAVPEPSTVVLASMAGIACLVAMLRKRL